MNTVNKIAIIGAGPSGIAAAKYLLAEQSFASIDIFEQRPTVGGVWNHTPFNRLATDNDEASDDCSWTFLSPMYDELETNIPHQLMQHGDLRFPVRSQLYPSRQVVLNYLTTYAEEVLHLVRFSTRVVDVRRNVADGQSAWLVKTESLHPPNDTTGSYDAVLVASGHYNEPLIPKYEGLSQWNKRYPGCTTHSKYYRAKERYRDSKVILVGSGPSGLDIGAQIRSVCAKPMIVSVRGNPAASDRNTRYLPEITRFLEKNRGVIFSDGTVEEDVDAIVFCTGYIYSYPFLTTLDPHPFPDGIRPHHVYKHIFYNSDPTLAFIGLPQKIVPFPIAEVQASAISGVWAGRLSLPDKAEMELWEATEVSLRGAGKSFNALPMPWPANAAYINALHDWSTSSGPVRPRKIPPRWNRRDGWVRESGAAMRQAFAAKGEQRHNIYTLEQLGFVYREEDESQSNQGLEKDGRK